MLVSGSRDFTDRDAIYDYLNGVCFRVNVEWEDSFVVIQGGQTGADQFAQEWAAQDSDDDNNVSCETFEADWTRYGRAAGPLRNTRMLLEGKPDLVLAFVNKPLGRSFGTLNMVQQTEAAGIPLRIIRANGAIA